MADNDNPPSEFFSDREIAVIRSNLRSAITAARAEVQRRGIQINPRIAAARAAKGAADGRS